MLHKCTVYVDTADLTDDEKQYFEHREFQFVLADENTDAQYLVLNDVLLYDPMDGDIVILEIGRSYNGVLFRIQTVMQKIVPITSAMTSTRLIVKVERVDNER